MEVDEIIITVVIVMLVYSIYQLVLRMMPNGNKYRYNGLRGKGRGIPYWLRSDDDIDKPKVGRDRRP